MKLTEEQLNSIKEFAKQECSKNDLWHQLPHIEVTVKLAEYIAKKEKADVNKCIVASWLHDIARYEADNGKNHGEEGAIRARAFLKKLNLSEEDIDDICYAIREHSSHEKKKTKEAEIVWDADKIQSFGPQGLIRVTSYFCAKHKRSHNDAYKKYLGDIQKYMPGFHTKTAKDIVNRQNTFMNIFDELYTEMEKYLK